LAPTRNQPGALNLAPTLTGLPADRVTSLVQDPPSGEYSMASAA
jgi:hypothetical protein